MKNLSVSIVIVTFLFASLYVSHADTKQDIDNANKNGKVVFLVVTDKGNQSNKEALNLAQKARKLYSKSEVIELDKTSIANYKLVQDYRLSGAPTPLILVIGKNGVVVGGAVYNQTTAEDLVAMIPTPKLEEVYASIADSKPVILMFTKITFNDKNEVFNECNKAVSYLKKDGITSEIIQVDIDDTKEKNFMDKLRIDKSTKSSVVIVINKQGQVSGTATSIPDAKKLASAAKATPKGGCGPGCGPAGCGK